MTNEEILFLKSLTKSIDEDVSCYDLNTVFKISAFHSVLPLSYENISHSPNFYDGGYQDLKKKIFSIVFSQAKRTENFKKIYKALLDGGITPVVIKGIILRQLYGDLCDHRPSGDEDILIKKTDFFNARDILIDNGYIPEENVSEKSLEGIQEVTFKSKNGLSIEVHLNLIGTENKVRRNMNKYFDNIFESIIPFEIDGCIFYTLDYTEHYIYLFYHLFKHFAMTGVGVRQIVDMFKFAQEYNDKIDWEKVYSAVEAVNGQKLYGDIIQIGNMYMGFSLDNKFGVTFPERLLNDMFSAGAYGNGTSEQAGSKVKVMAALDTGGKWSKLRSLFPSIQSMREHYTILYKHPYLLPVMWIVRIIRYIFRSSTGKTYNVSKSEKIADNKIQLLKDYHIL